jgi:hypothetical protein
LKNEVIARYYLRFSAQRVGFNGFILLRPHVNVSFITPILSRLFCYIWESDFVYVQTWWPLASTKSSDHLF